MPQGILRERDLGCANGRRELRQSACRNPSGLVPNLWPSGTHHHSGSASPHRRRSPLRRLQPRHRRLALERFSLPLSFAFPHWGASVSVSFHLTTSPFTQQARESASV